MKSKTFYNICLTLFCLLTNYFQLSAQDDPCLNFSSSFTLSTQPNSLEVSFNNQSTGDYLGGTWYFGDGTDAPANTNPMLHSYPTTGYYQVCLEIYSIWCYSQTCKWVRVPNDTPPCTADFSYQPDSDNELIINFTDNSSFQSLNSDTSPTYIWDFGDGNTVNTTNPTHQYAQSGIYDVCLYIINNETGCNDTICYPVPAGIPNCTAGFVYQQSVVNGSPTVVFTNQSTYLDNLGTANYLWDFDDSTTSTDTNPTHSFSAGQYEVCLTINILDDAGSITCSDSTCQTITITDCTAAFQYISNNEGTATFSDFSTSTAGNITDWSWDFGDGSTATTQNPIHQYSESGTYPVCLTISTDQDCTDIYCENVLISINTCQANFTYTPNGANIIFTNASTASNGIVSYQWLFGDGTLSTATNTSHIYSEGEYQVCLTITATAATNNTVLCTDSTCQTIIVGCDADFEATVNESGLATFTDQSTTTIGNIVAWAWDFGNGITSAIANPSMQYAESGDYNVCLTIITDTQCSDELCQLVTVDFPQCQPQFSYTIDYSNDNEVNFTNLSPTPPNSVNVSYWWDFGDSSSSFETNPTHFYGTDTYQVCLTTTYSVPFNNDLISICSDSTCQTITIGSCVAAFQYTTTNTGFTTFSDFSTSTAGNIIAWIWDFGDGGTATTQNPTHQYSESSTYLVCLDITTDEGCVSQYCESIPITIANCNAEFSTNVTAVGLANFTDQSTSSSTIIAWDWVFDNGLSAETQNPSTQYTQDGNYNVCLTINDSNECSNTHCENVPIDIPSCNALFEANIFFSNGIAGVTLTNNTIIAPTPTNTSFFWEFGDGTTSNSPSPTHTYPSGTYQICLTVDYAVPFANDLVTVCSDSTCQTITIGNCNANFTSSSNFAGIATFTDQSTSTAGTITAWNWNFGDGTNANTQNATHQYTASGTYNVCLNITTNTGCTSNICNPITVSVPTCNADFLMIAEIGGLAISTTNISTHSPATLPVDYLWEFGDGTTSTAFAPSHSYTTGGTYQVCLTQNVMFGNNTVCSDSTCQTITIGNCNANFTSSSNFAGIATFTDQSTSTAGTITAWNWNFGDGTNANTQNATHQYTASGTYNVCLNITTNTGCTSNICNPITVSVPTCNADMTVNIGANGLDISTTNTSTHSPTSLPVNYLWEFGDGTTSTAFAPSHSYTTGGTYQVCLTQNVMFGNNTVCSDSTCQTITIGNCNANFTSSSNFAGIATFTDQSTSTAGTITAWNWNFGDGTNANTQNATHQYTASGTYNVCLNITTNTGCTSNICNPITVSVPTCNADMTVNIGANGLDISTTNTSTHSPTSLPVNYLWEFGDGTTSTAFAPSHSYTTGGTYQVCLTQNVMFGNNTVCSDSTCQTITIGNCNANFTSSSNFAGIATFTDQSTSTAGTITAWNWNFGDGTSDNTQNATHQYTASGTYNVCLNITTNTGCTSNICNPITVSVPTCNADFLMIAEIGGLAISTTNISTHSPATLPVNYLWEFGDGTTSTAFAPSHSYTTGGTYQVCLTQNVMFGNNTVCSDSTCQTITIGSCSSTWIYTDLSNGLIEFTDVTISNAGNVNSWTWTFGDGTSDNTQNPIHQYTQEGAYTVCLTIGTDAGCSSISCQDINILFVNCGADFSFVISADNYSITTTNLSTYTPATAIAEYIWDFGDGTTGTEFEPAHTYTTGGTYQVCLIQNIILANSLICTDQACTPVTIIGNCNADFTISAGQLPQDYVFGDISSTDYGTIETWSWDLGDGSTSTEQFPYHHYDQAGTYTVCLTITNEYGCTATTCHDVTVSTCSINFDYSYSYNFNTELLDVSFTSFADSAPNGIDSYSWTFGDGTTSTEANPTHAYAQGTYNVCLTITSGDCTAFLCQGIDIGDCQAYFIESINGLTVNFDNQSWSQNSDIESWLWDFGDGTTSTDSAPADHTYPAIDATYTVCLTLVAFDNCTSTYCTNINILAPNTCTANYTFIANGTTVDFFDTSTASDPITTWSWSYLGFVFSTEQNPIFDFGLPDSYDITLTISTADNCTTSITQTIVLDANCSAWFNYDGVGNNAVVLVDNSQSSGGESITDWTWDFGDDTGTSTSVNDPITHQYPQAGTYDVCLTITTDGGCQDTYCRMVIAGAPCNELFANFSASQVGTSLDMQFNDLSQGNVDDYLWNFGDGTFSNEASPLHTFAQYGSYDVCLTVSSDAGCSSQICEPYTLNPQIPPVVSEFQISPTLLLNPNEPITVKIESPQEQSATVWIRAVNGQHIDVLERELTVGSNVITVEHRYLSPAMYVVSVILESGVSYNAKVVRF